MNQCDGCARGLPLEDGIHFNPDGSYDMIVCTAYLYGDAMTTETNAPSQGEPRATEDETYLRSLLDDLGNAEVQVVACWHLKRDGIRSGDDYERRCAARDAAASRVVAYFHEIAARTPPPAPSQGEPRADPWHQHSRALVCPGCGGHTPPPAPSGEREKLERTTWAIAGVTTQEEWDTTVRLVPNTAAWIYAAATRVAALHQEERASGEREALAKDLDELAASAQPDEDGWPRVRCEPWPLQHAAHLLRAQAPALDREALDTVTRHIDGVRSLMRARALGSYTVDLSGDALVSLAAWVDAVEALVRALTGSTGVEAGGVEREEASEDDVCGDELGGFVCTRRPLHSGDHIAHGVGNEVMHRWAPHTTPSDRWVGLDAALLDATYDTPSAKRTCLRCGEPSGNQVWCPSCDHAAEMTDGALSEEEGSCYDPDERRDAEGGTL